MKAKEDLEGNYIYELLKRAKLPVWGKRQCLRRLNRVFQPKPRTIAYMLRCRSTCGHACLTGWQFEWGTKRTSLILTQNASVWSVSWQELTISATDCLLQDRHADGHKTPEIDSQQNYELISLVESGGKTTMKFKRKLKTCDPDDNAIQVNVFPSYRFIG